jgi:SAM-dependent methyltransferase
VRDRGGTVLELGCGSGLLTRYLMDAGLRVIATDASLAMPDLARDHLHGDADLRRLVLPGGPLPAVDAVVSVRHVLSYWPPRPPSTALSRRPPRLSGAAGCWPSTCAISAGRRPEGKLRPT